MEDKDWFWHDDAYKLDAESPLAISRSLWDGLAQSEADSRSLFASTPTTDSIESDRLAPGYNNRVLDESKNVYGDDPMQEGSPRSKRRRMLLFPGSSADMSISDAGYYDPLESPYGNHAGAMIPSSEEYEKYEVAGPSSPSSMWYLKSDDGHYGLDEVLEPASQNWMVQSYGNPQASGEYDPTKLVVPVDDISGGHPDFQQSYDAEVIECPSASFPDPMSSTPGRSPNSQYFRPKTVTPVAYPFALLKPCGAQGDVTLNDINQRISMPSTRSAPQLGGDSSRPSNQSALPGGGSPGLSGKSVVARTKIHTEGNGTITIMRTRG